MDESHASAHAPLLSNGNVVVNGDASTAPLAIDDDEVDVSMPEDATFVTARAEQESLLATDSSSANKQKRTKFILDGDEAPSPTSPSPSADDIHSADQPQPQSPVPPKSAPPYDRNLSEPTGSMTSQFSWSNMTKKLRHTSGGGRGLPVAHTEPTLHSIGELSPPPPAPCTSPSPKLAPKKVRKYYQQQTELLENYKADNETIQEFERKRRRTASSECEKSEGEGEEEGGKGKAKSVEDEKEEHIEMDTISKGSRGSRQSIPPRVKMAQGRPHGPDDDDKPKRGMDPAARRLAAITLLVNVMLLIAKTVAVILSGSFSIISSLVDSSVDITSGLAIWMTARAIKKRDPYLYPRGRTRLEPLALVIVSVIMGVASVQMIVQSVEAIVTGNFDPHVDLATICIMCSTVVVKFCLMLVCRRYSENSSINVLGQDHRNDCISNSVALLCAFLATREWSTKFLDPIGAILVSLYIAGTWFMTGKEHIVMLSGRSADPGFINRIIKVCMDHDERIQFIDTVYVYHFGTKFLVEVHVVMDRAMSLQESHDISERLQINIEHLPEVERAFVHCDYESDHRPEDEHKVV